MNVIARGLEIGHPAAYALVILIIGTPLMYIIMSLYEIVKDNKRGR